MAVRRPLPPVVLLVTIGLIIATHFWVPLSMFARYPFNLLGLLPLGFGIYLNLAADSLFKRHHTTVKPFQQSTALITSGVYAYTRHPMYLGFVLILLGIVVLLGSVGPLVLAAMFAVLMDRTYVRVEEAALRQQFGAEWTTYKTTVRKWL